MYVPSLGDQVPTIGNRLTRALARWALQIAGWRFEGEIPNHSRMVVVAAPHTTAVDFFAALPAIAAIGIRLSWMGAEWVFRVPLMRLIGGIKVDRAQPKDIVAQTIDALKQRESFVLALAPEGTRKKRVPWKTGFYRIAHGAGVPLFLVAIDPKGKTFRLGPSFLPSGDYEADMEERIKPYYAEYLDKYPERFGI